MKNIEFKSTVKLPEPTKALAKFFDQLLQKAAKDIITRTQSGREIEGAKFAAYTPKYALYKGGEKGRSNKWSGAAKGGSKKAKGIRKGLIKGGTNVKVDLTYTGAMLRGINTKIIRANKEEIIGAITMSPEQVGKAIGNQTGVRGKKRNLKNPRPFFGLSQKQKDDIQKTIMEAIKNG
jgi:hypothetical protein